MSTRETKQESLAQIEGLPFANPEEVGISSERLSRIRLVMQRYVDRNLVPGIVSLIARNGRVVHFDTVGFRDVENRIPMTSDTIFRIMSMTKPITSVALMMLYEEGHFLLSDPVSKWIPEFSDPKVAVRPSPQDYANVPWKLVSANRPISIRHLLTHTAGLSSAPRGISREEFMKVSQRQSPTETIGDFVKRYATVPLNYHPGESWEYSRATCIVGHLVEIISGMTLDKFFKERIFEPLNMTDTSFYLPIEKLDRFSAQYTPDKEGQIQLADPATVESRFVREPHLYFMGSGGLLSTIKDYFRFDQMMLNGGTLDGASILGRKTVEFMTKNHTGDHFITLPGPWAGFGLGFGVVVNTDNKNTLTSNHPGPVPWSVGSYTWGGAYCTFPWVDPVEKLIGIVMTQVGPYRHLNIRHDFIGLVYQSIVD